MTIAKFLFGVCRRVSGLNYLIINKLLYRGRVKINGLPKLGKGWILAISSSGYVNICELLNCRRNFEIRANGTVKIGRNCFFNNNTMISSEKSISIGDNCIFGENVSVYDNNHQYRDPSIPIREQGYTVKDVKIGNNCWIASGVIILKGSHIGDNCVIGTRCIINGDIPSGSLVRNKNGQMEIEPIKYINQMILG